MRELAARPRLTRVHHVASVIPRARSRSRLRSHTRLHRPRPAEERVTEKLRDTLGLEPRVCVLVCGRAREIGDAAWAARTLRHSYGADPVAARNRVIWECVEGLILSGENKYPSLCASG